MRSPPWAAGSGRPSQNGGPSHAIEGGPPCKLRASDRVRHRRWSLPGPRSQRYCCTQDRWAARLLRLSTAPVILPATSIPATEPPTTVAAVVTTAPPATAPPTSRVTAPPTTKATAPPTSPATTTTVTPATPFSCDMQLVQAPADHGSNVSVRFQSGRLWGAAVSIEFSGSTANWSEQAKTGSGYGVTVTSVNQAARGDVVTVIGSYDYPYSGKCVTRYLVGP